LVLNSSDTANILQTVDFVREISRMININAVSAGAGLGEMFA
jgi:hypothetical protein